MDSLTRPHRGEHQIAIVGGGASGTLLAVHLLRQAAASRLRLHVKLVDQHGRHGLGQAYSTEDPAHQLNAMVGQMSAVSGDPDHLLRWAAGNGDTVTSTTFLARQDYGRYLLDTLTAAEHAARPFGRLTRVTAEVLAVRRASGPPLRLILRDSHIASDVTVLATGNTQARLPFDTPASDRVVTDPWRPGALASVARPTDADATCSESIVIVGTGLTTLDLAVSIAARNPNAVIHAVSRHGLLPRPHPGTPPRPSALPPVMTRATGPVRLTDLMWQARAAIAASPTGWFDVMDALRPHVPALWQRLPMADKRLFLRHVARYWEVHRHLIPPATASRITALMAAERLIVHPGRVSAVTAGASRLRVQLSTDSGARQFDADWLVNSTGSTSDVTAGGSALVHDLFASGLARPDPLRLGIDAATDGRVLGRTGTSTDTLFALGPPLRGLWYETTAIPEIREQAAALAQLLTGDHGLRRRPGSAA